MTEISISADGDFVEMKKTETPSKIRRVGRHASSGLPNGFLLFKDEDSSCGTSSVHESKLACRRSDGSRALNRDRTYRRVIAGSFNRTLAWATRFPL